ncbi:uncharacterized protein LOC142012040 [Carettochelys insculpta]|uniref:uncharacterized protein LOC142012040 n=1 Tax=Carettochelys insculpta TaxID=44489 RepID=UPI003EBEC100
MVAAWSGPLNVPAPSLPVQEAERTCRRQPRHAASLHVPQPAQTANPAVMAARQPPQCPQGTPPKGSQGSQGSQAGSQGGKWQRGPSWTEAELWDLLGLWSEEEVLQVMGSKRRNADAFARLAEGLAARGHPARTPDHVQSKVKELRQGYARARDAAGRSGAAPVTCPFYRELRDIVGTRHTSSPPATLDTSAEESQQALQPESAPEVSPAPRGPPLEPTPRAPEQEEEEKEGDSSSTDTGLHILLPSRSSSQASAPWVSPDCGSGPTAAPSEGPESAGEASAVPESPPGPSLQASPSAEDRPAPRWARRQTQHHHPMAADPQLLALHRRQVEVAEQQLRVEQRRLHLQEGALAWRQEAWGAYMETFNHIVDYLAPRATVAAAAPALTAPPATPPAAPVVAAPSAFTPPPATEGHSAEGDLGPADTRWPYLPVRPAPSQPRTGLRPRQGSRPPTASAGLQGRGAQDVAPPLYIFPPLFCSLRCI